MEGTKPVLVTGGGSLLGEAVVARLVEKGWCVLVTDVDPTLAEDVLAGLPDPSKGKARQMNVVDRSEVATVVTDATEQYGGVSALVNLAGGGRGLGVPQRNFVDFSETEKATVQDVNLYGVLNVAHAVLPAMIANRQGEIVSVVAARGLRGGPKASVYSASKAGVIAFSQSLAQEVARHGVRVNTVAPGSAPARWKDTGSEPPRSPLGRATSPDDVGHAVAFLLSEEAHNITGACLDVSGGTALY